VSRRRHKRKRSQKPNEYSDIQLNIVPFIDVFSMLNTFLLFSAVFVATGIIEVQIPFLSSAPPPPSEKVRFFQVKVDVLKDKIEVITSWSEEPVNEQKTEFPNTKEGIREMHTKLVEIRSANQKTDKLTLFTDDEVTWENISQVLDSIKLRTENDPRFPVVDGKGEITPNRDEMFVWPKVVMGSVIL